METKETKAIELGVAILQEKLNLATTCIRFELVYLSQVMYTPEDVNDLTNAIAVLKGLTSVRDKGGDCAEIALRHFRFVHGEKLAASAAAKVSEGVAAQALDVIRKIDYCLVKLFMNT